MAKQHGIAEARDRANPPSQDQEGGESLESTSFSKPHDWHPKGPTELYLLRTHSISYEYHSDQVFDM